MFQSRAAVAIFLILVAAMSRILPHPPNMTPILALSLFAGAQFSGRYLPYMVPVLALLLSDLVLGFHDLMWLVYSLTALTSWFGSKVGSVGWKPYALVGVGSVVFFVTTNLAVWWTSGMYAHTWEGLSLCFTLALPFFQNSLVGDFLYTGLLFGTMSFLDKKWFLPQSKSSLRTQ